MSGMDQTNDWPGGGTEHYTTDESWDSRKTTADEYYPTSTDKSAYGATAYPGESTTTTTTQQWTPITTDPSTSAQPTTTASTSQSSATSTATSVSSKSNTDSGSTDSSNVKTIAIAVPVAVVGAIIIAALLFFIFRRGRQRNRNRPIPSAPQVDMVAVPRELQPPPNRSSTWEFAPTNSHDLPFSGPIPGRPVPTTSQARDLDPTSSNHPLTAPIPTDDHQHHLAPTDPPPPAPAPPEGVAPASRPVISPRIPAWPEQPRDRPTSPFDHPLDDAVSEISRRSRDLDDISSVSSFGEDDERRPAMHHP
ncbi:hypothetical protein BO78DRAFT_177155 [Aspergillus sclerotiicarbonarius CBS 121057]|uniref:Uncharacterized protein n=1 Tax=Aspergillus sclerotiicarbonarius (strain CBS 121057 / IBT 28362) TaxID=1448318 RepID=A0A319E253_ASPSB|nr:hypothetical protein BO78DRAFT_177155 [Aspergillus sclerotiicarbonarius CBS 121057]